MFIPLSSPHHTIIDKNQVFYLEYNGLIIHDGVGVCCPLHQKSYYHDGFVFSIGKSPNPYIHHDILLVSSWDNKGNPQKAFEQEVGIVEKGNYLKSKMLCCKNMMKSKSWDYMGYHCEYMFQSHIALQLDDNTMKLFNPLKLKFLASFNNGKWVNSDGQWIS